MTFSTPGNTNAVVGFAASGTKFGTKKTKGMTATSDVFRILTDLVDGKMSEVNPFDAIKLNYKGMFADRIYNQ